MNLLFLFGVFAVLGAANQSPDRDVQSAKNQPMEERQMDPLTGKRIKWMFDDGPVAGTTYEHTFGGDGSVTWTIVEGPHQGATEREKSYGAVKVNDKTIAISYLATSGYTLSVVLNLDDQRMFGFASNDKEWYAMKGTFELVK
jgi:hypothetical protein